VKSTLLKIDRKSDRRTGGGAETSGGSMLYCGGVSKKATSLPLTGAGDPEAEEACDAETEAACGAETEAACGAETEEACGAEAEEACGAEAEEACGAEAEEACDAEAEEASECEAISISMTGAGWLGRGSSSCSGQLAGTTGVRRVSNELGSSGGKSPSDAAGTSTRRVPDVAPG
jgi:hypothetical protein